MNYGLHEGIKREYSKTKIMGRLLSGELGIKASLSSNLNISAKFIPGSRQYRLNADKEFLTDYPVIYKYYGDSLIIKNESASLFDRKLKDISYHATVLIVSKISRNIALFTTAGKIIDFNKISENVSEGRLAKDDFGEFQLSRNYFSFSTSLKIPRLPIIFSYFTYFETFYQWARTPRYQTLFEEMKGNIRQDRLSASFFEKSPFSFSSAFISTHFNEKKVNYFQHYSWDREIVAPSFLVSCKVRFSPWLQIIGVYRWGKGIPEYHLTLDKVNLRELEIAFRIGRKNLFWQIKAFSQSITPDFVTDQRNSYQFLLQMTKMR